MPGWYDFKSLEDYQVDLDTLDKTTQKIFQIIETEKKSVESSKIFLGGFSQGSVAALYAGLLKWKEPLGGIIGLSGYCCHPFAEQQVLNPSVPLFLCNGMKNKVISIDFA